MMTRSIAERFAEVEKLNAVGEVRYQTALRTLEVLEGAELDGESQAKLGEIREGLAQYRALHAEVQSMIDEIRPDVSAAATGESTATGTGTVSE